MGGSTERLFVYGTLGPGGPNEHLLARLGGRWIPAAVRGRLREAGWGADAGYPAIVLDETAEPVQGHVFASEELARHWEELDAFEGGEYERVLAEARLADGSALEVHVYVLRE